jgi:nitrite reductase (NO-forming)
VTLEKQVEAGKVLFAGTCSACHQASGQGIPQVFPPLAGSDYLKDKRKAIETVLNGLQGPVTVNGQRYDSVMPPQSHLPDDAIANILTFVFNSWGNPGGQIKPQDVTNVRESTKRPPGAGE